MHRDHDMDVKTWWKKIGRLKEHTDNGHHRQSSVGKFSAELLGFLSRVRCSQNLESKVTCSSSSRRLVLGNFAESHVCQDLTQPAAGTLEIAASPLGTSANFKPADGDKYPGNLPVISGVIYPIVANIEILPCLSSVWRRRLKFSTLPSAVKPAGSQKPTGACTPSSFSKARRGEAV